MREKAYYQRKNSLKSKKSYSKRFQTHQHYHLKNGREVIGVTTVLSQLNKPALMMWAWNLGKKGLKFWEVTNQSKNIGTVAHYLIECKINGELPDKEYLSDFTKNEVDGGYRSYHLFCSWLHSSKISFYDSELQLVSEEYEYGGTIDIIACVNGKRTLIDIKTGKSVFLETQYQLSAYRQLYNETHSQKIQKVLILHLPHEAKTSYTVHESDLKELDRLFEGFVLLLRFREINRKLME